jgi:hypothetical protein
MRDGRDSGRRKPEIIRWHSKQSRGLRSRELLAAIAWKEYFAHGRGALLLTPTVEVEDGDWDCIYLPMAAGTFSLFFVAGQKPVRFGFLGGLFYGHSAKPILKRPFFHPFWGSRGKVNAIPG